MRSIREQKARKGMEKFVILDLKQAKNEEISP
jgi:hypothetical protein